MKQKLIIWGFLFVTGLTTIHAQWLRVGKFNNMVNDMHVIYNQLYIAGNFDQYESSNCYFTSHWDDSVMTLVTDPLTGIGVRRLQNFQNLLYGTNALNFPFLKGLATYNMNTWNSEPGITTPQIGIYSNANNLYVGSDAGQLNVKGTTSPNYYLITDSIAGSINAITEYNGALIVAGNFTTVKAKVHNHIVRISGNNYTSLSSGLDGNVSRLLVYNGNLYACGNFINAGGSPAKFLAKWNDNSWSQVGGGIVSAGTLGIMDMMVHNNALYIAGEFSKTGNSNAINIAKWNDTSWTSFGYNKPGYISAVEAYKGMIYVASRSGDSAVLYKTAISSGINRVHYDAIHANIFPNPATNEINISLNGDFDNLNYEIMDMEAKVIVTEAIHDNETTINMGFLKTGIYMIRIKGENRADVIKKFVVL